MALKEISSTFFSSQEAWGENFDRKIYSGYGKNSGRVKIWNYGETGPVFHRFYKTYLWWKTIGGYNWTR